MPVGAKSSVCDRGGRRLSDRFAEDLQACPDLAGLRKILGCAARDLGFEFFALVDHASLARRRRGLVREDNYPQSWVEELLGLGDPVDDPVHLASRRTNTGFRWCELHQLIKLDSRHRKILSRSRRHGLGAGFTVPANVPGEPSASCSFVTLDGEDMPVSKLGCAELIGAHALRAARRLRPARAAWRPHLSRREIECLRLIARGKTDWEIATILDLSIETAHQYVKRARAAYDVATRSQLIVHGLRDAWISFEDTIPHVGE